MNKNLTALSVQIFKSFGTNILALRGGKKMAKQNSKSYRIKQKLRAELKLYETNDK